MQSVTIRAPAIDFSREMAAMRGWFDQQRHELTRGAGAEAFARRFDGKSRPRASTLGQSVPAAE